LPGIRCHGHRCHGRRRDRASVLRGRKGTAAVAGILSGRVNPSGRLPVSIPASEGTQPSTYLAAPLARSNGVSSIDPTAASAFAHG
jgi:beta-xylosidase